MALGLVFAIVAVLIAATGYWLPSVGIASAQAVDGIASLSLVMAVTSLNEFRHSGRRQAIVCRQ
jgi:hypothetical protein